MRLQQYINETENFSTKNWEKLKNILEKDCKPYINQLKGVTHLLMRGVKTPPKFYELLKTRTNRKPRMLDNSLHQKLDNELKKMYGWKVRSEGLFTVKDEDGASQWGNPTIVFPVGEFKYLWLDGTFDLYYGYDAWNPYNEDNNDEIWSNYILPSIRKYNNKNLNRYLKTDVGMSECIIKCDKYYLINREWDSTLLEYFSKRYYR